VSGTKKQSYAVLGGGILGLTLALRLLQQGNAVTVFERESLPGGLAAGFPVAPELWLEKFYHHLFTSDDAALRLIREVDLEDRLLWKRPRTVVWDGSRAHQLDSPGSLLRFSPLRFHQRVRMGLALAFLRALPSARSLEGRVAASWIRRVMGDGPFDKVWKPLLVGKFGDRFDQITLPWFWARVHDRSSALGYIQGGFQLLYQRLSDLIVDLGGDVQYSTEVRAIATQADGLTVGVAQAVTGADVRVLTFDRIVSTLPTRVTSHLAAGLPQEYRARYDWGEAYGAHTLVLALDRALTDSYWMSISDSGYPFLVLVEHTNYMSADDYGGRHLVYLGNYRPMGDALFSSTKMETLESYLPFLARINPDFERAWIQDSWIFHAPHAQPIVTVDYLEHIPPLETPVAGLYLANMFQVYPHDRGQNYSIALAEEVATRLAQS